MIKYIKEKLNRKNNKIARNLKLIPWYNFFIEFRPIQLFMILFYAEVAGSYALAMSLFTVSLLSQSASEVPTGIISDKYLGRAKTMTVGAFLNVLSFAIWGIAAIYGSYTLLVVGSVIEGIAYSFYSGNEDALLYETMKQLKKEKKYHEVYGRFTSMYQVSAGVSALIGGFVAHLTSYAFLIWITLPSLIVGFIITLFYIEPKKHQANTEDHSFKHLKDSIKIIMKNKKLRSLALIDIVDTACGNISHRFQVVFFKALVPVWAIGIIRGIKQLGGSISFYFAGNVINKFGVFKTLIGGSLLVNFIKIVALGMNNIVSPFLFAFNNLSYGTCSTAQNKLLQNEFTDKQRATLGSIISFFGNIMFGILSILVGYIADIISARDVLLILMIPEIFIISYYFRMMKKGK